MDALNQQPQPSSSPTPSPVQSPEFIAMQLIKKQYFLPQNAEQSTAAINSAIEIVNVAKGKVVFNFDPEKAVIDGYAIVINPINQRNKATGKTDCIGITVGAIPTLEVLNQSKEGQAYVLDSINAILTAKLMNATRPNSKGEIAASIPYTVSDFVTTNRADGVLLAYRKMSPSFINALKAKNVTGLSDPIFRQTLTSTAFANATFPNFPQEIWVNIINKMIEGAAKLGIAPGMLEEWLKTRDNAGLPEAKEVDINDLMDLGL